MTSRNVRPIERAAQHRPTARHRVAGSRLRPTPDTPPADRYRLGGLKRDQQR